MTTGNDSSTPPPLPEASDSRLDLFLQKAAPIIAVERGINAKSRILLEALARDSKLPEELFNHAIRMLQGAPPVAAKTKNRWVEAFARYLHAKFQKAPPAVLTADLEARAMKKGVSKFQLSEEQARDAVREVATQLGIRRISRSEAERHIADLVSQKVGDAEWLDDGTVKLLHSSGTKWGLSTEQVDAVIGQSTEANRQRRRREHRTTVVALTAAGFFIVILFSALVALFAFRRDDQSEPAKSYPPVESPTTPEVQPAKPVKIAAPPNWWDDGLTLATVRARISMPSFAPIYEKLASSAAAQRGEAYQQIAKLCRDEFNGAQQLSQFMLDRILIESYALEPDDEAADRLRDSLLSLAEVQEDQLPQSAQIYELGFWAVRTAVNTLGHNGLSDQRADALVVALGRTVRTVVHRGAEQTALQQHCQSALAKVFYAQLTERAAVHPHLASDLHLILSGQAARIVRRGELNRLDATLLGALLLAPGNVWTRYRQNDLIAICINSGDPVNVLKFVEVLERTADRPLQLYLTELLIRALEVVPTSAEPQDVAAVVRGKLGVTSGSATAIARDRWRILAAQVQENEARRPPSSGDHHQMLENIVVTAHLATMACAVAQQEPGFPVFDQLLDTGPPNISASKKETFASDERRSDDEPLRGKRIFPPTSRDREDFKRYVECLKNYQDHNQTLRLSYVKRLANLTERIKEVSADDGSTITKYLLAPKDEKEQSQVLETTRLFAPWANIKLALADQIVGTDVSQLDVAKLVAALLGHPTEWEGDSRWRQSAYEQLLRSVLDDLRTPKDLLNERDPDRVYDAAGTALHGLWKTRAKLLGLAPAEYEATTSAAQIMRLLVEQSAAKLGPGSEGSADGQYLARLPHELKVVEFLGSNDVKQTVLLQRTWLSLLALQLKSQRAERAKEAAQLLTSLAKRDSGSTDLLAQLLDGEATALQMWVLYGS